MILRYGLRVLITCFGLTLIFSRAVTAQNQDNIARPLVPLRSVAWFNNEDPDRSVWDEAQIYHSPDSKVQTTSASIDGTDVTGLPITTVDGQRTLVFDTINPGYWNTYFIMGSGNPVNVERIGSQPVLHLRVRWGSILPGDSGDISVAIGKARVKLSAYVTASTTSWQDVNIPLSNFTRLDKTLDLTHVYSVIIAAAQRYTAENVFYLAALNILPTAQPSGLREDLIKVDMAGWRPNDPKLALFTYPYEVSEGGPPSDPIFDVVNNRTDNIVFTGRLVRQSGQPEWNPTGDDVYAMEFTELTTPGSYRIVVPGVRVGDDVFTAESEKFSIGADVYTKEFRDSLRYYYYERGGYPVVDPYGEGYIRPGKYPNTASATYHYASITGNYHYLSPTRDVFGGWCDAGDPSLQVPDHAMAIWWLSNLLREYGTKVPAPSLNLPESTVNVSDIAPLMNYGLRWMEKMCNPDGSVLDTVAFQDGKTEEITDSDSVAAALAAASFAKAFSVLHAIPACRVDADEYLTLAKRSWEYLSTHPAPVSLSGATSKLDPNYDSQCRIFAAVELFNATGDDQYNQYFLKPFAGYGDDVLTAWGGSETGNQSDQVMGYLNSPIDFAYLDYIDTKQPGADKAVQNILIKAFLRQAHVAAYDPTGKAIPYLQQTSYRFAMLYPGHLYWGSNCNVLSVLGVVFERAYLWTGDVHYRDAALDELHFINGRNPVDRDFVSGEAPDYVHGADFYSQLWLDLRHQPPGVVGAFINVDGQLNPYIAAPWKRFINFQEASSEEPDIVWNCEFSYLCAPFAETLTK
jgi:endoglucanase